jgi:hypothetical protein
MIWANVCILLSAVTISLVLKIGLESENVLCVQMHLTLGWTAAIVCMYMAIIDPAHMANRHYVYNPRDAANFAAFAPVFWCLFTAWIIFISYVGHGGMYSAV